MKDSVASRSRIARAVRKTEHALIGQIDAGLKRVISHPGEGIANPKTLRRRLIQDDCAEGVAPKRSILGTS